jgi:putative alpha-1,2-mannosidase
MHDYDQLQIMPQIGSVDATVNGRQLEYRHENETAHPDYYAVTFDNGIKTEITPSSHSAIFRFTYPISVSSGQIVLDSLLRTGQIFCRDHFAFDGNNIFG